MDDSVPHQALGPCGECGYALPSGTLRYCVHCGAEVAGDHRARHPKAAPARPGYLAAPGPPSPAAGPSAPGVTSPPPAGTTAERPATTWSTGEFRAPSPLDGVTPLPPPVIPTSPEGWYSDAWYAPDGGAPVGAADPWLGAPPVQEPPRPDAAPPTGPIVGGTQANGTGVNGTGVSGGVVNGTLVNGVTVPQDGGAPWPGPPPRPPGGQPAWPGDHPVGPNPMGPNPMGPQPMRPPPMGPPPMGPPPGPPGEGRTSRSPVLPLVAAAIALVVVTTFGLLWLNARGTGAVTASPSAPPAATASAAQSVVGSSGAADAPPSVGPSGSPSASVLVSASATAGAAGTDVVRTLDGLLDESTAARGDVASTAVGLQSCQVPATQARATFRKAGDARNRLAGEATVLPPAAVAAVPGAGDAVRAFIALQQASARADDAFADWAEEVARDGCRGQARHTTNWELANRYSAQASTAKARFVRLWNPIASAHGLGARSADAI